MQHTAPKRRRKINRRYKYTTSTKQQAPNNNHKADSTMWTRPAIEILLNELRKRRTLYDQRHPDYLNRAKRQVCLESICKVLYDKVGLKVHVEALKSKIQVIRSQFNKDLRGMVQSKKYKPKFWCFKKMEWLKPYCNNRYNPSTNQYGPPSNSTSRRTTASTLEAAPLPDPPAAQPNADPASDITNSKHQKTEIPQNTDDQQFPAQSDMTSTTTLEADDNPLLSSNILTSKMVETVFEEPNKDYNNDYNMDYTNGYNNDYTNDFNINYNTEDINEQFYETIALTQQIVQNRIAAKAQKATHGKSKGQSSWEGDLVTSQLNLISDETIRSDTMWEIQCVLRRGIEQDRVLPKRRRRKDRRLSLAPSEASANGSYISLDSNDSSDNINNGV